MTPQCEEAERYLRMARRDETAFLALLEIPAVDFSVACFHAQQACEKALKAAMCLLGVEFRRTHDLEALAGQLGDAGCSPAIALDDLRRLTPYAVEFRYDDEAIALLDAKNACRIVAEVLAWVTALLERRG